MNTHTETKNNLNILLYKYEYDFIKWIDEECKKYKYSYDTDKSPMWIQYSGFDYSDNGNEIYFKSSQSKELNFTLKIDKKHFDIIEKDIRHEIYNHFKDLKYNYISKNYPRIFEQINSWRNIDYNKH